MSSALKPVLTAAGPQNSPVPSQLNKPMHPQNVNSPYGQPSTHMSQNLVNLPLNNPNAAHNNPAHTNTHLPSTHQPNHYSLNVPNAPQHYMSNQTIPVSNHPVPNISQSQVGIQSQAYNSQPKSTIYSGNYQPNLGHPPNVLPPAQSAPVTQPPQQTTPVTESVQSNGTPEIRPPVKATTETQQNHLTVLKDKSPSPAPLPQTATPEKPKVVTPEKPPVSSPSPVTSELKSSPEVKTTEASPSAALAPVVTTITPESSNSEVTIPTTATTTAVSTDIIVDSKEDAINTPAPTQSSSIESTPTPQTPENSSRSSNVSDNASTPSPSANNKKTRDQSPQQKSSPPKPPAMPRTPTRKSKTPKNDGESPKSLKPEVKSSTVQKSPSSAGKSKRTRTRTQPYQSPLPELEIISKMTSTSSPKSRGGDDKLIIFYKNEFLAVRNSEGGFYVCQAVQNIYKSSPKIRIRWLSQEKNDKSGEIYSPDFYDNTDFDCILTNLNLERVDKGKFRLPPHEKERTDSILKRALAVEKGDATPPSLTEEHPDGLDLSLYKEESQLQKRKGKKRKASSTSKSRAKVIAEKKSPEQPKVPKVEPKRSVVKTVAKKPALRKPAAIKPPPAKKAAPVVKKPVTTESKKPLIAANLGRAERAKRRGATESPASSTKTSPVVDQKKAKVLAKVARKAAVSTAKTRPVRRKH